MTSLSVQQKIVSIAHALNLKGDPVEAIMEYCRKRVGRILKTARSVRTPWDLERAVCEELNLVIHDVSNDEEIDRFIHLYAIEENDPAFAALRLELADDACGVLFRRKRLTENGEYQYVAFIDCRGAKRLRRFFTRWHEIAHCLTSFQQYEMPFRRTTLTDIEKDPVEKLMDLIAGDLGFFEPLFQPVLNAEVTPGEPLTFEIVERIRSQFCPDASNQAVLAACAKRINEPIILIEAIVGLKKTEQRIIRQFPEAARTIQPQLRVRWSVPNSAAQDVSFQIPRYMRVPKESIITKVFLSEGDSNHFPGEATECLGWWTSSKGGALPITRILVQAARYGNGVIAIITRQE